MTGRTDVVVSAAHLVNYVDVVVSISIGRHGHVLDHDDVLVA